MARYFAYGMNMDLAAMATRCSTPEMLCLARLDGYRFEINTRGVATVVDDPDGAVYGVLWELCDEDLDALDRFEGVAVGNYRRAAAAVARLAGDSDNEGGDVVVYIATDASPGPPRPGYLEAVAAAAAHHGFPEEYLAALRDRLDPPT